MLQFEKVLQIISDIIWGPPLLILLLGTHIFLTFKLRLIQKYLPTAIKLSFNKKSSGEGDISHFGALMTALAATIGTGNIVGVATAISLGGPGAVLWMWITGVFGIATKYAEAVLSIKYRVKKPNGEFAGGPMYVLEKGMNLKWLGTIFAILTSISAFGIGNMVQSNSISVLLKETFNIQPWISGLIIAAFTAMAILGGITSIAKWCEKLVPFMAIFYILGCLFILLINISTVPSTIALIFSTAFTGQAAIGGFAGASIKEALRYGVARGLFSNESGLGSAPIVAAAARTENPTQQALVSSTGTFWDTVVVCALTGLVIVNSGEWTNGLQGAILTKAAFEDIPYFGPIILSVGLLTFVFSTILGWSYYGEKCAEYVFGTTKISKPYRWFWVIATFVGSILSLPVVWTLADITNGLMAIPNLISLLVLNNIVVKETAKYIWKTEIG